MRPWSRRQTGAIWVQREGATKVLYLVGEVDLSVVTAFDRMHGAQPVAVDVIDAGAVSMMTSAGLQLMLRGKRESMARGRAAALRRSSRSVDRLLTLTGLHRVFDR